MRKANGNPNHNLGYLLDVREQLAREIFLKKISSDFLLGQEAPAKRAKIIASTSFIEASAFFSEATVRATDSFDAEDMSFEKRTDRDQAL